MWELIKEFKFTVTGIVVFSAMTAAVIANEVGGTYEVVGEPYTYSYSYCGAYAGVGGTRHCSLWLTGTERRVNTKVHGLFFDTTSYKVVAR